MVAQPILSNSVGLTDAEMVLEDLAEQTDEVRKRAADLLAGLARMPETITDRAIAERAAAFAKQLGAHARIVEDWREKEKGKWDDIAGAVHRFLKPIVESLDAGKKTVNARILAFDQAERSRAAEEQRIALKRAQFEREEAERLAREAQTDGDLDAAIQHETAAREIAQQAAHIEAPRQIRAGDYGVTASVRRTVAFRVVDLDAVPRQYLMLNEAAVKAHAKTAQKGELPTPVAGIEFHWNEQMVSR